MESSSSGSSRRARTPGNGSLVPSCMVDGCAADLGNCRDYHRRHKVCELHSKTSKVFIKGNERRFCQQCSRFHSLVEFDEGKRSCRKRLEGHNRRRRKPQRDSISVNSPRLFTSSQGTRYIHFGASQILSSSMISEPVTGIVKREDDTGVYDSHPSLSFSTRRSTSARSLPENYKGGGKQFFLQGTSSTFLGSSTGQVNVDTASNMADSRSSQEMFSDGLNRVVDSNRALSLLSSPPAETQEINMVHPELNPQAQSLISSLNYSCTGVETEPVGSVLVSDSRNANLHGPSMFHVLPDGPSATGSQPRLSFSWE